MFTSSRLLRLGRTALVAALCLLAGACGKNRVTKANFDKITDGMTLSEVEAILGKGERETGDATNIAAGAGVHIPGAEESRSSAKGYFWEHGNKKITIHFANDKVLAKRQEGL
jgi:hypothetical protein